jgi:transposase
VEGCSAVWLGAPNFVVLDVVDGGVELVISIESTLTFVGCTLCGTRARPKDRRWVSVRDAPARGRAVLLRSRKRVWSCPDPDCATRTWTERSELADARRVLTNRAAVWATDRVAAVEGTPASIARGFDVAWSTVWTAIERVGRLQLSASCARAQRVRGAAAFDRRGRVGAHARRGWRVVVAAGRATAVSR